MGLPELENCNIAVLGLGYVGLPLAIEFARKFAAPNVSSSDHGKIIGYDIDRTRIKDLIDRRVIDHDHLADSKKSKYGNEFKLKVISIDELPEYIKMNWKKYEQFLENLKNLLPNFIKDKELLIELNLKLLYPKILHSLYHHNRNDDFWSKIIKIKNS